VGPALKGKEEVEQVAKKFVKENKLEVLERKKFINNAAKHAEATKSELSKKINETIKATVDKMWLITHKEMVNLKKEIRGIAKNLRGAKNVYKVKNVKKLHQTK
jgi:polyhydroxyalkanoate synthesis regulator phasin